MNMEIQYWIPVPIHSNFYESQLDDNGFMLACSQWTSKHCSADH